MNVTIIGKETIGAAWWRFILSAPNIADRLRPGQFLMVRCADLFNCYLRRPLFAMPLTDELLMFHLRPSPDPGLAWLLSRQVGDTLDVLGPLGHGFPLIGEARQICLVSDSPALTPLLGQMQAALTDNRAVTLALGAPRATQLYPLTQLPPQIEYQVATLDGSLGHRGTVMALLPDLLRWADVVYAIGSADLLQSLKTQTAEVRFRLPSGFVYGLMSESLWACGLGACLGCHIETARGPKLLCTDGPVFDLAEL